MLKQAAKDLLAKIKPEYSEEDLLIVNDYLKEIVIAELFACIHFAEVEKAEWGEVAVRVNKIVDRIVMSIDKRKAEYVK